MNGFLQVTVNDRQTKIQIADGCGAGVVDRTQEKRLLVLGAGSKLGRLLRHVWQTGPSGWRTDWQSSGPYGTIVWQPDSPLTDLPPCDAVLALWGVTPGRGNLDDNSALGLLAMQIGQASGAARVLHCSSAAVYAPQSAPLRETEPLAPVNSYGSAKQQMEEAIVAWAEDHRDGPKPCSMRIANVVGADSLFASLHKDAPVTLDRFEDGQGPLRSYTSPHLLARAIEALLSVPIDRLPAVINIASSSTVAMEALARAAGREVLWRQAPASAHPNVTLDTSSLAQICPPDPSDGDPDALIAQWHATRGVFS